MDQKFDKSLVKWEKELEILKIIEENVKVYIELKDQKGSKDEVDRHNAKITNIEEDNRWVGLDWKVLKRSKASRLEALDKLEKKIGDREEKIEEATKIVGPEEAFSRSGEISQVVDWDEESMDCHLGSIYYNWAYGKMEVVSIDQSYIYLLPLDRKGIKHQWIEKNNVPAVIDQEKVALKQYSKFAIGKTLFPLLDQVKAPAGKPAHKIFL